MKREGAERKAANLQELLRRRGQQIEERQAHNKELKKVIAEKDRQLRENRTQSMSYRLWSGISRTKSIEWNGQRERRHHRRPGTRKSNSQPAPDNGNHKGGQPGHAKIRDAGFDPEQAKDTTTHELKEDEKKCRYGGDLIDTGR